MPITPEERTLPVSGSILKLLKNEIDSYETENCKMEIVNDSIVEGGTDILNYGSGTRDILTFRVKVTNQGELDMKKVKVKVSGTDFAEVGLTKDSFSEVVFSEEFNLDANIISQWFPPGIPQSVHFTEYFFARTKAVTNGQKVIVEAQIYSWDASLEHLLNDHSGRGDAEGKLIKDILPA